MAQIERLLGKDYEVITADDRLDKIADDFVEHCALRWQAGKSMLVCIDKVTCGRMWKRIMPKWEAKAAAVRAEVADVSGRLTIEFDDDARRELLNKREQLERQAKWMEETIIEIIISEAQNEVSDFKKWDVDIIPHRARMKQGFEGVDGKRLDVEQAFKKPDIRFGLPLFARCGLPGLTWSVWRHSTLINR